MMRQGLLLALIAALLSIGIGQAQTAAFPYPTVPVSIQDSKAQIAYILEHFWSLYQFNDTTAANRHAGEEGFVNFIDVMQYGDSLMCACGAAVFADSICADPQRLARFEGLMQKHLGNAYSPLRNDVTYAHLLRALPQTPQRSLLLAQVSKNQPYTLAADFQMTNGQRLYDVKSQLLLLVFCDDGEASELLKKQMDESTELQANAFRLKTLFIKRDDAPEAFENYYLPTLPALYLLGHDKKVFVKDGSLEKVIETLQWILN